MRTIHERLFKCFANVFPEIRSDEIPRASTSSLAAWDSVAHVVLLTSVSEEFGCNIAPEDFEHLTSYGLIAQYVTDGNSEFDPRENDGPDELQQERPGLMTERAN
jgi:acyl carrier protein